MLLIIKKETKVAKVVTFANVKGGSGKSTLCINMAAILVRAGYSVAIIDADHQKCSQDWITGTKDKLLSRDDIVGQGWIEVFLKQSNQNIKKAPILTVLNGVNKRSSILSHVIEQLKEDGVKVAETCISQRVCFAETNVNKISVIGYNKHATKEIVDLTNEALNLIKSEV